MRSRTVLALASILAMGAGGCDGCGHSPPLRVDEPRPHLRCMAADPPRERKVAGGRLRGALDGRTLRVPEPPSPVRIAAFAGPAPMRQPVDDALKGVAAGGPDLILVLGSVGDDGPAAKSTLRALGAIDALTVVLAGGRDDAEVLDAAFGALDGAAADRVVDGRALWELRVGETSLALVSGAPGGRYARTPTSCGHGPEDLEAAAGALGDPPPGSRVLVTWAAPRGWPGSRGLGGVPAGSPRLADHAEAIGAKGGLFAWPASEAAPDGEDGIWRVPSLLPVPAPGRGRAAEPGGVSWLALGPDGLRSAAPDKEENRPSSSP